MLESLTSNPVRLYSAAVAILALVSHYVPTLPSALILAVAAAILGTGEVVRSKVAPMPHVAALVEDFEGGGIFLSPDSDDHTEG